MAPPRVDGAPRGADVLHMPLLRRRPRRGFAPLPALLGLCWLAAPAGAQRIPLVDLDRDAGRHTVVDREAGQYLGHVSTTLLGDGRTILAVYPKGHGKGATLMKKSADGGRSWSERLPTPENWATSLETPTIHRVPDPVKGGIA